MNFFGEMAAPFVTTIPWKGRSRRNTVHEGFAINFYICIARFRSRASKSMVEIKLYFQKLIAVGDWESRRLREQFRDRLYRKR